MSNELLIQALEPVLKRLPSLNLTEVAAARATLEKEFPLTGALGAKLKELSERGLKEGWLCNREGGGSKFSRVAKPEKAHGYSIDAVLLSGDGPWHKHTKGEINVCLNWGGTPKFCGHGPGWAVFAPGSEHIPSVSGGSMLIFYLLPEGAMEWKK